MGFFKKLFGKEKKSDEMVSRRDNQPDVYHVKSEEEEMNWAMEKARLTIDYFRNSVSSPSPLQQYFSVKVKIVDGDEVEHIWLTDVSFDETGNVFGDVGNKPLALKNVKEGQKIGAAFEDISDWMIIEEGTLVGGYTTRVLRNKMKKAERESFDRAMAC